MDKVNTTITRVHKVTTVHVNRLNPFYCIRWEDGKHRVFASLEMTSELIVLVTWMMLRVTVGNSGYEMKY
jgi:hypothetical protein